MNGTVHLFCLFPCRVDDYFPKTVSANGEEEEVRRICEICAWLGKLLKSFDMLLWGSF